MTFFGATDGQTLYDMLQPDAQGSPTQPAANEYLTRLTGYSLTSLQSEPARIADEAEFCEQQLVKLCLRQQATFIDVHACSSAIESALDDFTASLDDLMEAIPDLEAECSAFQEATRGIQADRAQAALVSSQQDVILDTLDLPLLVDTCVRNGYYQEAMQLAQYTRQLATSYPQLELIPAVARSVEATMQVQAAHLLAALKTSVKLPAMGRAISFLRQMGGLSERQLALAFLESRADHLRNELASLSTVSSGEASTDKVRHVRRHVDVFREAVYDTVSQYDSLFLEPSSSAATNESLLPQKLDLLSHFVHHSLAHLSRTLTTHLPAITDASSLSSLLTQLGYSAMSFARLGMDSRSMLRDPFETAVKGMLADQWTSVTAGLEGELREAIKTTRPPESWLCSESAKQSIFSGGQAMQAFFVPIETSPGKTVAPSVFTSFPPLARYLNASLSILNALRLLAPLSTFPHALDLMHRSLTSVLSAFETYTVSLTSPKGSNNQSNLATSSSKQTNKHHTRPNALRRNTSISNRGQIQEHEEQTHRNIKRVLVCAGHVLVHGLVPFLNHALEDVVYDGKIGHPPGMESKESERGLDEIVARLDVFVNAHREEPGQVIGQSDKVDEMSSEPKATTGDEAVSSSPPEVETESMTSTAGE